MPHPIGIDLGTTNSAISKWVTKRGIPTAEPYIIAAESSSNLPSKVFLEKCDNDVKILIGKIAQKSGVSIPEQFIKAVKRKMGQSDFQFDILGKTYSPIDISAEIIKHLLRTVEGIESPGSYVPGGIAVTVPYYFKQPQNLDTKKATLKAINDLYADRLNGKQPEDLFHGLIAEPIAVGLDYSFSRESDTIKENILVFDLGGGTFDLTLFSLEKENKNLKFTVLAVDGDEELGGEDFDSSLFQWICMEEGIDLDKLDAAQRGRALKKIDEEISNVKHTLSWSQRADFIVAQAIGADNLQIEDIKRSQFEACISGKAGDMRDYYSEIEFKLESVLNTSGLNEADVDWVLLAGGSSQIPVFKKLLEGKFGSNKIRDAADIRMAVTRGAAIYSAYRIDEKLIAEGKPREHLKLWDNIEINEVTAHQLGIDLNGKFLKVLNDNVLTPASQVKFFTPTKLSEDGQRAILDELVMLQGNSHNHSVVGQIQLDDIYTHGKKPSEITVKIKFTAETNLVRTHVYVKEGNADKSDYLKDADLKFANH